MKKLGCSDFWDVIVERYCDDKEIEFLSDLSENEFERFSEDFEEYMENLKDNLKGD